MKKFLILMFALTILTATVEAADVPDIRQISQNIALVQAFPADENSAGVYEYTCEDDNATRYFNQYVQLMLDSGFEIIDGRQQGDDVMIWGLIHPDKDVPVFQFELDTPVHVLIKQTGLEFKIQTAPGITYGEE